MAQKSLAAHYPVGEAAALVKEILFRLKGWTPVDLALKANDEASPYLVGKVRDAVDKLLTDEPVQYIFGVARFYGMDFKVNPSVLIPRPETAELVDIIVKYYSDRRDLKVLDICTGSGAIAIALARNLPFSEVEGIDISSEAIATAKGNAVNLKAKVAFEVADALKLPRQDATYDLIVSNPPYIDERDKATVEPNVLLYEPHQALFVPHSDPLLFYRAISGYAASSLRVGGALYFEINPKFADDLRSLLQRDGWSEIEIIRDSYGAHRFAKALKSE